LQGGSAGGVILNIITKFNDYEIHPIEFFITLIKNELALRDLSGVTNGMVKNINVSKEHPLVLLMQRQLANNAETMPSNNSNIVPAIGITPGNPASDGIVMGHGQATIAIDDDWIAEYDVIKNTQMKDRVQAGIITDAQIALIKRIKAEGHSVFCRVNKYRQNEEVNISLWTETSDMDMVLSMMVESILSDALVGFMGDDSKVKNMKMSIVKGLTNFNFGRVLYGTEYSIQFLNTRNNYMVYSEERFSSVVVDLETTTSGEIIND
jgi:hypothetical protein